MPIKQKRESSFFMIGQSSGDGGLEQKVKTFKANKTLSLFRTIDDDLDVSVFEGLTLSEYLEVKRYLCSAMFDMPFLNRRW